LRDSRFAKKDDGYDCALVQYGGDI